ncbi:unnamed protein product [Orchesella dallaii]|uniref:Uncharacterized protein n=1 Tax=Orchesella dallaii TaxID=48710 RepID=A0ABP1RC32_9HEXA
MDMCKISVYHVIILIFQAFWSNSSDNWNIKTLISNVELHPLHPFLKSFQKCSIAWGYIERETSGFSQSLQGINVFYQISVDTLSNSPILLQIARDKSPNESVSSPNHHYPKFCSCQISFLEISEQHFVPPPPSIIPYYENSNFFVYFTIETSTRNVESLEIWIRKRLIDLPFSGIQLLLLPNTPLKLLCLPQFNLAKQSNLIPLKYETMPEVQALWKFLHQNLNGLQIIRGGGPISKPCMDLSFGPGPQDPCIVDLMREKLNVTIPLDTLAKPNGYSVQFHLMSAVFLNSPALFDHNRNTNIKLSIPPPGITIKSYSFMIVTSRVAILNDLNALTQPFQRDVWFTILLSAIFIPMALTLSQTKALRKFNIKTYWEWIFLSFAALLDQCSDSLCRLFTSFQSSCLWLLWNFFCIIITNCYDGQLYSFLSSEFCPVTPNNLKDIASSNYSIVTFNTNFLVDNGTMTTHSQLQMLLNSSSNIWNSGNEISFPNYYKVLSRNIHFVSMTGKGKNLLYLTQVLTNKSEIIDKQLKGFAFVDSDYHVQLFASIVDLSGKKRVVKKRAINNFAAYQAWIVRKFNLQSRFEFILWQSVESGLKSYWYRNNLLSLQLLIIKHSRKKENQTHFDSFSLVNYLIHSFEKGRVILADEETVPIPLELLSGVLKLGALLALSASILFVAECLHKKTTKVDTGHSTKYVSSIAPCVSTIK